MARCPALPRHTCATSPHFLQAAETCSAGLQTGCIGGLQTPANQAGG